MSDRRLRPYRPYRPHLAAQSSPESDASGRYGRKPVEHHAGTEPAGEEAVLAEVAELLAEGVLEPVPDDWEFVVTRVVAPGIEIGFSRKRSGPCRYPAHRSSDWTAPDGRLVCGICHPPASTEAKQ